MNQNTLLLLAAVILLITLVTIIIIWIWNCTRKKKMEEHEGYQIAAISAIGRRLQQQDAIWFSGMRRDDRYYHRDGLESRETGERSDERSEVAADAFIRKEDECIAVLADGMGGLQNGREISTMIVNETREAFFCRIKPSEPVMFMQNMLWKVNECVNRYLDSGFNEKGGSTDITVYIRDRKLYYYSVGDSRLYLVREQKSGRGRSYKMPMQVNREHNFGYELDELARHGVISAEEAMDNPRRAALTSYVGMGELAKVDGNVAPIPLGKGDLILLMSDGVFGTLNEQELLACMEDDDSVKIVSQIGYLIEKKQKMKQDNYSVIAIRVV